VEHGDERDGESGRSEEKDPEGQIECGGGWQGRAAGCVWLRGRVDCGAKKGQGQRETIAKLVAANTVVIRAEMCIDDDCVSNMVIRSTSSRIALIGISLARIPLIVLSRCLRHFRQRNNR
jgi:hypothetical protein